MDLSSCSCCFILKANLPVTSSSKNPLVFFALSSVRLSYLRKIARRVWSDIRCSAIIYLTPSLLSFRCKGKGTIALVYYKFYFRQRHVLYVALMGRGGSHGRLFTSETCSNEGGRQRNSGLGTHEHKKGHIPTESHSKPNSVL